MNRWLPPLTVVLLALLPAGARAQGYAPPQTNPFGQPAVSPYLNLLRGGNPALNYLTLVRPIENFQQFQQASLVREAALQSQLNDPNRLPLTTGYNTRFMSYTQYFGTIRPAPVPRVATGGLPGGPGLPGGR